MSETSSSASIATEHPEYSERISEWNKVRDCLKGEKTIKQGKELYLPRPKGMAGDYADAYDAYIERAHFPLVASYALTGVLGVVITKLPEFNVPDELKYILENATKDGRSLQQLFLDVIIEIFTTGRVPLTVDILPDKNEFRFVQYKAEDMINWKTSIIESERNIILAVFKQSTLTDPDDEFSHDSEDTYIVMALDKKSGKYFIRKYSNDGQVQKSYTPSIFGNKLSELPITVAGSINNSVDVQPIPLLSVANCSIQIYRKEADLANSEFLSCNPTLVITGATDEDKLPNVVGSSVLITVPEVQARVFYTTTDTAALTHVKDHINDLYEEAIRHGVAILDTRKGVEAAEALRIRQATQSASVYSVYLSAVNAIKNGLLFMCKWASYNKEKIVIDAPNSLTFGVPDSSIIKEVVEGFGNGIIPLTVIHKYLINSGLLDQTIGYEDYVKLLVADKDLKKQLEIDGDDDTKDVKKDEETDGDTKSTSKKPTVSKETKDEVDGAEDKTT